MEQAATQQLDGEILNPEKFVHYTGKEKAAGEELAGKDNSKKKDDAGVSVDGKK